MKSIAVLFALLPLIACAAPAKTPALPPIAQVRDVTAGDSVFEVASEAKPLVIGSEKAAAAHFSKDELAKLTRSVDFTRQTILVFAWHGSGEDRFSYAVAESFPEQVTFSLTRGRTKDLRPHVYIYVLRQDVKWTVAGK